MDFITDHWGLVLGIVSVVFIIGYGLFCLLKGARGSVSEGIALSGLSAASQNTRPRESEGERRTRAFLEEYFQKPFPKIRPDFLKNKITHSNLEIDCFNEELKLAAEYNGRQHYEYVPYFHASKEAFHNQQYRDELKRLACKENDILLIEVHYSEDARLEEWLGETLDSLGFHRAS